MVTRIRRGARPHLYVKEWREERGLSLEDLGGRIRLQDKDGEKVGVERNTVWRWENEPHRLNPEKMAAIADALDLEPEELWRPPGRRSLDAIASGASDDVQDTLVDIVTRLTKRAS